MSDDDGSLDDIKQALRLIMATSRKQIAMISATQIAFLSVIEQLVERKLIDAVAAAHRMDEMAAKIPSTDEAKISEEVTSFSNLVAALVSIEAPMPPNRTKPTLVE